MKSEEELIWEAYNSKNDFLKLVKENTYICNDYLYHATSIQAVYSIAKYKEFYFNPIGSINEEETLSTSLNPDIVDFFGKDEHKCRITFKGSPFNVFIIPKWLLYPLGWYVDDDIDQDELNDYLNNYSLPEQLPYNFLRDNLPNNYMGFMQKYVVDYMDQGRMPYQDEMEITFLPNGENWLKNSIFDIIVDNESFNSFSSVVEYLEETYEQEYLEEEIEY